jgi:hypothetical protein
MRRTTRTTRGIGGAALVALAVGLSPAAAIAADEARDIAGVCEGRDGAAGTDVAGHAHETAIRCVSDYEIAKGYDDATYRPDHTVTRGQMAAFVARFLVVADAVPSDAFPIYGGTFTDTPGTTHEASIELLAKLEVVQGRADGTFGHRAPVNRGQMARFLVRAIDQAHSRAVDGSQPPAATTTRFDDARGTTFATDIEQLRELGIYLGDSNGDARPHAAVTRGQMASFLARTADYLDELRRWRPTYEPIVHQVAMSWANVTDGDGSYYRGEEDAIGGFAIGIDEIAGRLAYAVKIDGVSTPFPAAPALSLHTGKLDEVGAQVLAIDANDSLAYNGEDEGQMALPSSLDVDALVADPAGFYVELRTVEFPDGAIRGQLPDGGQDRLPDPPPAFPGADYLEPLTGPLRDLLDGFADQPGGGDGDEDGGDGSSPLPGLGDDELPIISDVLGLLGTR